MHSLGSQHSNWAYQHCIMGARPWLVVVTEGVVQDCGRLAGSKVWRDGEYIALGL